MLKGQVAEHKQGCKDLPPLKQQIHCQKIFKMGPAAKVAENLKAARSLILVFQG